MSSLPWVGESLDKTATLETKARRLMRGGAYDQSCSRCKTSPYPRGFCTSSQRCWYCEFPRKEAR